MSKLGEDWSVVSILLTVPFCVILAMKLLVESSLIAAIPANHWLARTPSSPLALALLADEPWALFPDGEGPGQHGTILQACAEAGFTPKVAQRALQMETMIGLVAAGLGVALVPELFRSSIRKGVIFRDLSGPGTPVPYRIGLIWQNGRSSSVLSSFLKSTSEALT